MPSDPQFIQFILDQFPTEREMTCKAMFGGHTLYSKGKVVALICDNQLFVKPTEAGKAFVGDYTEAPAYPGAKPSLLIVDQLEDRKWLSELIQITEESLPTPKPRKKKKQSSKKKKSD